MSRDAHATAGSATLIEAFRATISLRIALAVNLWLSSSNTMHHVRKCLAKQQAGSAIEYNVLEMHVGIQGLLKAIDELSSTLTSDRYIYAISSGDVSYFATAYLPSRAASCDAKIGCIEPYMTMGNRCGIRLSHQAQRV
jgi:hypothetical protein